ncbi:hypothetical protein SEA_COMRADE_139 [Streptomyces phage Comrade]|uniref:Uncharacterized protein n=3 Tax=Gilsonvirus comrade TaxID=2846395 RepID=A0A345ME51_9CAUD|nr:hypothetical protein HWB84_gp128 [Streptomyces phage Comrade]AXH68832.1 hypothetical protein SEA_SPARKLEGODDESS_142 [Streptomyces phage SparkleGoddess]QQO39807.1 hypothetical protein SEA_BELFORT_143 [Streptomyces phage Belfort]QZE11715.1 hypothetical protein SEA_KARP_139 [Streptomyces phage Karp]UTN92375.1 hypothetical protein SEA_STIGMA_140 [Streptomyces phage Stigma]AXQ63387.1 hypothetical protein SEA_COMRADE_139 [Streptomyces phage Comrade]
MGLFNRTGFSKGQKVYVVKKAEYGRITEIKRDGMIKVDGYKTGEMWVRATDIESGN